MVERNRSGREYRLLDEAFVSDTMLADLLRMVGCPSCGAEPGELCLHGWEDQAHPERWLAAREEGTPGKVSDGTRNGRHYVETSQGYFCRRFPPRRSLGHEYQLTEVDPLGWCGEFRPAGWVRDRRE